jgi:hypothetical protein
MIKDMGEGLTPLPFPVFCLRISRDIYRAKEYVLHEEGNPKIHARLKLACKCAENMGFCEL